MLQVCGIDGQPAILIGKRINESGRLLRRTNMDHIEVAFHHALGRGEPRLTGRSVDPRQIVPEG